MGRLRRRRRGKPGEIEALLDLLDEHRGAFEYDWRTRFGLSATAIGTRKMTWGEAWRQIEILLVDSTSQLAAAVAGWTHPVDRQTIAAMDLYDLQHEIAWVQGGKKGKKPKPYPRPWPTKTSTITKPSADLTQAEIIAALRVAGHTAALPAA